MKSKVTLYRNTALQPGDVLDDKAKLDLLFEDKLEAPVAIIKQERYLVALKVEATVDQVDAVDYARIGEICYWVTGYTMLNDNVAALTLVMDGITTVGIANVGVISGWCTRRCVVDDKPFANTIEEPFKPTDHFRIEIGGQLRMKKATDEISEAKGIVLSTVNLSSFGGPKGRLSELWESGTKVEEGSKDSGLVLGVFVPSVPPLYKFTEYFSDLYGAGNSCEISGTCAFLTSGVTVALQRCHALGLDNVLLQSYEIPDEYISESTTFINPGWDGLLPSIGEIGDWLTSYILNTQFSKLACNTDTVDSKLNPVFGSYKNSKVYTGQFQKYTVMSLVSGNSCTYDVEDVLVNGEEPASIKYKIGADLRYNGFPVIAPLYYKGESNAALLGSVTGGVWQSSPIGTRGIAGYGTTLLNQRMKAAEEVYDNSAEALGTAIEKLPSAAVTYGRNMSLGNTPIGSAIDAGRSFLQSYTDEEAEQLGAAIGNNVKTGIKYAMKRNAERANSTVPNILFSQVPNLQSYIGNRFYEYRVLMSEADMQRFDRFLTMFGYSVSEPLTHECFGGRTHFNYVQAEGVNVDIPGVPLTHRRLVVEQIEAGVRIWHDKPSDTAFSDNPIAEV